MPHKKPSGKWAASISGCGTAPGIWPGILLTSPGAKAFPLRTAPLAAAIELLRNFRLSMTRTFQSAMTSIAQKANGQPAGRPFERKLELIV
jgi:hypothetical protein